MNKSKKDSSTPLSGYKKDKKVLTPPLATLPNMMLTSWTNDRMPDMLWAVLIRRRHPGKMGYAIFRDVLSWIQKNKRSYKINGITHTDIASYDGILRKRFINHIVRQAGTDALKPILLFKDMPAYDDWRDTLGGVDVDPEAAYRQLAESLADVMFHQTQEATDVRWVKLMGSIIAGKISMPGEMIDKFIEYPEKYDQRSVRPSIRSSEMATSMTNVMGGVAVANEWPIVFWRRLQDETICMPEFSNQKEEMLGRYKSESDDKKHYNTILPRIRESLVFHSLSTSTTTGVDPRHESVFGLAIYALDVFIENVILTVGGTSSGRVNARIIFETYITLKYLIQKEQNGDNLWATYRDYGIGQFSLIDRKYKEEGFISNMVDPSTVDLIANEDKWQEYVSINLGNWDSSDLRTISIYVGEKGLYDKYYSYTSGFIHANWGAVREASMQRCLNPLHRAHRIPRFELPVLPSTNEDCRQLVNKVLEIVDRTYPSFTNRVGGDPSQSKRQNT